VTRRLSVPTEHFDGPLYRQGAVLVTGGSGFIGTHLISALLEAGAHVVNIDIKAPVLAEHTRCWVQCDLGDEAAVRTIVVRERPVLIYNLAAHARLDGTAEDMRINVVGVQSLVQAMAALPAMPLMVQASTMVVAGSNADNFDPTVFDPQFGLYAQSKVEARS
jgi:nucleoside-diphosphate-sugar epimerase